MGMGMQVEIQAQTNTCVSYMTDKYADLQVILTNSYLDLTSLSVSASLFVRGTFKKQLS